MKKNDVKDKAIVCEFFSFIIPNSGGKTLHTVKPLFLFFLPFVTRNLHVRSIVIFYTYTHRDLNDIYIYNPNLKLETLSLVFLRKIFMSHDPILFSGFPELIIIIIIIIISNNKRNWEISFCKEKTNFFVLPSQRIAAETRLVRYIWKA